MNKLVACVILFLMVFSVQCWADEQELSITWDYLDPPSDLAGFKIYINEGGVNATLIEVSNPLIREKDISQVALLDGNNTFEMTAYDEGGQESVRSEVLIFDPAPSPPIPIKIVLGQIKESALKIIQLVDCCPQ